MGQILRQGIKSALARWVLLKRRGHRTPAMPTPQDEATHAWDGDPQFAEDYTFVGVQAGLGVVLRLESLPGRESQRIWAVILRPDGVWAPAGGLRVVRSGAGGPWSAGGLHLDCQTPLREWTVRFSGPLVWQGHAPSAPRLRVVSADEGPVRGSIDLTFVSADSPYVPGSDDDPELLARRLGEATWDARLWRAARRTGRRGYVQSGQLHGTIAVGDVLITVRAMSLRQHSWGACDMGAVAAAYQCFWATEDRRHGWLHHARLPLMTFEGGFSVHRGHVLPVRRLSSTAEARPGRAARVELTVGEEDGTRRLQAELVSDFELSLDAGQGVTVGLARITGRAPGWGLWAGLLTEP